MRWLALMEPDEEARYLALGARLVGRIERSMHPAVVANRPSTLWAARGRLRLEPLGPARARWRREVDRLLGSRPGTAVVADVRDCYGSIRVPVVREALLRAGCAQDDVVAMERMLDRWEAAGWPGLPVGPIPSAVLANAVLSAMDREISSAGWRHVRWVDDLVIAAREPSAGGEILERLRACLARLGLRLAEEKCRVVGPDEPSVAGAAAASGGEPAQGPVGGHTDHRGSPRLQDDVVEQDLCRMEGRAPPLDALHALRRLADQRLGGAEANAIRSVADDRGVHELVRAWAWRALARTDPRFVLERAAALGDEPSPVLRRAVAVAVALSGGRSARLFLRHHGRTADGRALADWGLAR